MIIAQVCLRLATIKAHSKMCSLEGTTIHLWTTGDSSVKRTLLRSARRHRMWAFAHSSRLRQRTAVRSRPPMRTTSMQMSFPETVFDSLCRNWFQTILEVKMLDVQVLGWCGHSCSQHANCTLPQNLRHLWHCAHFRVVFYCGQPKAHLCNNHAV